MAIFFLLPERKDVGIMDICILQMEYAQLLEMNYIFITLHFQENPRFLDIINILVEQ